MADKFMNDTMFDELLESTKQAVAISKNTLSASRRFTITPRARTLNPPPRMRPPSKR